MNRRLDVDAVLFDLDGTLADTAPDLIVAVNRIRAELGLEPVPEAQVRPSVSKGGRAMLHAGLPERPEAQIDLLGRFLEVYGQLGNARTRLFEGIDAVLDAIELRGMPWGIVTNKPGFLTQPLLVALGLDVRAGVVVCGDTLPTRKPDAAPVRHACEALGVAPERAVLVGDDRRDAEAAHAAGALAVVAAWGYIDADEDTREWQAAATARVPLDLIGTFGLA